MGSKSRTPLKTTDNRTGVIVNKTSNKSIAKAKSKNPRRKIPLWLWIGVAVGLLWVGIGLFLLLKTGTDGQQTPFSKLNSPDYHSLAFNSATPEMVFFGSHAGLSRSTDGGRSWQPTTLRNQDAMQIGVAADGKTVIVSGHDVFQKSSDGGLTWQNWVDKLKGATDIHAMAIDATNPNNIYFVAVGVGLIKSADAGATWINLSNAQVGQNIMALAYGNNTLWASTTNRGILRSQDDGQTWQAASGFVNGALDTRVRVVTLNYDASSSLLYAGTTDGVYHSMDGGNTWNKLNYKGVAVAVTVLEKSLLVLNEKGEIFRSLNGGVSWNN
jgi:photosystem II stability/assembly factor-like uncharacterized protein